MSHIFMKGSGKKVKKCPMAAATICTLISIFTCGCNTSDIGVTYQNETQSGVQTEIQTETQSEAQIETIESQTQEGSMPEKTVQEEQVQENPTQVATEEPRSSAEQAQFFSKELFGRSTEETNPVESPVSAYLAMALAGQGAKGDTAAEFDAVMGSERQALSEQFMKTLPAQAEGTKVALANSAWLDDRLTCNDDWVKAAKDSYLAEVYQTRLSTGETMGKINAWVEKNTQGLIKELLEEPLDDMTRVALFNTVYFKGKWQSAFDGGATAKEPFTLADGSQVQVDMMRKTGNFCYVQGVTGETGISDSGLSDAGATGTEKAYEGIVLDYRDSDLLFVALMPTEGHTVRELYENLTFSELGEQIDAAKGAANPRVDLWLPKFEVSFDRILNPDLAGMGLASAFDPDRADFTGIGTAEGENLHISLVRQKAVFIVDEEGTEAAAVTEVIMRAAGIMPVEEPTVVHFDKPFLYLVFDPQTDMPLFVGIMDDPGLAQK